MSSLSQPLQILSGVCLFLGIGTTVIRLFLRRRRLWWDDICALLAALCFVIQIVSVYIHEHHSLTKPQHVKVAQYYLLPTSFYGVVWFARLSILFSVMRINPDHRQKKWLLVLAFLFALAGIILFGQLFWICVPDHSWQVQSSPQCPLGVQVVILQVVTDVIADLILLILPLKLFRDIMDKYLRRRLMLIFSTAIATTMASIPHAVLIVMKGGSKVLVSAVVEVTISLVVCNFPVAVARVFRLRPEPQYVRSSVVFAPGRGPVRSETDTALQGTTQSSDTDFELHKKSRGLHDNEESSAQGHPDDYAFHPTKMH